MTIFHCSINKMYISISKAVNPYVRLSPNPSPVQCRLKVTSPATYNHCPLASTKLYCLLTEASVCLCQLVAQGSDMNVEWSSAEHRSNHDAMYAQRTLQINYLITVSLRFNGHFPGGPGLAGTRMSPFWIILELRMMEVVVTTGTLKRTKLQPNYHHQQTNTQIFTGLPVAQPTVSEGKT